MNGGPRYDRQRERRGRRRRLLLGVALSLAALGVPLLVRRFGTAPALPPHGWGRGHRYSWRGLDIHFQQTGEGLPVVLVHSLGPGHDGEEWRRVAEMLARGCDLLAPDLPGWGLSAAGSTTPAPDLYRDFLLSFLHDVVRRPAALVAAGGAAPFAIAAAAVRPEAVRALALVSPYGLGNDEPSGVELGQGTLRRGLGRLSAVPGVGGTAVRLATTRAAIQRHLEREVFAAPERADAARRERCYRSARQPGAQRSLQAWLGGGLRAEVAPLLPRPALPVWLGWGRQSSHPAVETADLWLHQLPHAALEVFDGCGALPHLEVPVEFTRRLRPFLQRA